MLCSPSILRLLDANANRAREALRVLEDFCRFVKDDASLGGQLKRMRHELAELLGALLPDAMGCRDTPGDVGREIKAPGEMRRVGLQQVVVAAGKRLGEALRSLEEYAKTLDSTMAQGIEALRYRFYDIEKRLSATLRPGGKIAAARLYVLVSQSLCRRPWLEEARLALEGGAEVLQLREKQMEGAQLLIRARQLVALCRQYDALCIINDRVDIALLSGADGVHVGQEDLPAGEVRKLLGANALIGVSTHHLEQARQAVADGADYIGVGPIFPSSTKPQAQLAGLDYARQVAGEINLPAFAISGINSGNLEKLLTTGLRGVAVSSAVLGQTDPKAAAERMAAMLASDGAK